MQLQHILTILSFLIITVNCYAFPSQDESGGNNETSGGGGPIENGGDGF